MITQKVILLSCLQKHKLAIKEEFKPYEMRLVYQNQNATPGKPETMYKNTWYQGYKLLSQALYHNNEPLFAIFKKYEENAIQLDKIDLENKKLVYAFAVDDQLKKSAKLMNRDFVLSSVIKDQDVALLAYSKRVNRFNKASLDQINSEVYTINKDNTLIDFDLNKLSYFSQNKIYRINGMTAIKINDQTGKLSYIRIFIAVNSKVYTEKDPGTENYSQFFTCQYKPEIIDLSERFLNWQALNLPETNPAFDFT